MNPPTQAHWYLHKSPLPTTKEWGEGKGEGNLLKNAPPLPGPLLLPPSGGEGEKLLKTGHLLTCVDTNARARVRERAGYRCEYCQLHQDDSPLAAAHSEHIVPQVHGGSDELDNLALACADCNLHKGTNLTGFDPQSHSAAKPQPNCQTA